MKRMAIGILVLACVGYADEGREEWRKTLAEIRATANEAAAVKRIAEVEAALRADLATKPSAETRQRLAEILVLCRVPRASMMEKGSLSVEAIGLLEKALEDEPARVEARYILARTCLALPAFFGREEQGLKALEHLVAQAEKEPRSVPYPDAFLLLAKRRPDDAQRILAIGLRSFPDDPRMRKLAEAAPPADWRTAKEDFRAALERGELDYGKLDKALAAGQQANPKDAEYPLLRGLLRLWWLDTNQSGDVAAEGIALFRKAMELAPEDNRIHGWLGPLLFVAGASAGLDDMRKEGEDVMAKGVELNPEQNLFGRAFAYRRTGLKLDQAEEDVYATLEVRLKEKMDRTRFVPGELKGAAYADSPKAPFTMAGFLYWAGEGFRERGATAKALDAYERSLAADADGTWPFRALAIERRDALRKGGAPGALTANPVSCHLCHMKPRG
jgi:tetratricopeptide (TPR) repeat protein